MSSGDAHLSNLILNPALLPTSTVRGAYQIDKAKTDPTTKESEKSQALLPIRTTPKFNDPYISQSLLAFFRSTVGKCQDFGVLVSSKIRKKSELYLA